MRVAVDPTRRCFPCRQGRPERFLSAQRLPPRSDAAPSPHPQNPVTTSFPEFSDSFQSYPVEARRQGRAGQYAVADERRSEGQGSGRVGHRRCGSTGTDGTFPRLFGWNRERPARPGVARRTIPRLAHLRTPYYRPAVQTSTMSTSREWCCWVSVRRTHVVAGASAGGPLFKSLGRLSFLNGQAGSRGDLFPSSASRSKRQWMAARGTSMGF